MTFALQFGAKSLTTLVIANLAIISAWGAQATTYTEVITASPSDFTCTTGGGVKTCGGVTFLFPRSQKGTGTLVSGSGVFSGKAGDKVDIDVSFSSPLYVPKGTGPGAFGYRAFDVAADVLYLWNGSQFVIAAKPSSASSTVSGYVGPPGLGLNETWPDSEAFVGFGGGFSAKSAAFSITGIDSTITLDDNLPYPVEVVTYGYQITVPALTVPEPASWAVLLIGLGVVGAAIRTRRRFLPASARLF